MSSSPLNLTLPKRTNAWKWWVCGLLLLATMVNYMDRVTLNVLGSDIRKDLGFSIADYGRAESAFALAFALVALVMGWVVDRWNVYWIYPLAVLAWSAAGFATGFVNGFSGLVMCRVMLGLAEAANWPCALRTTQRILAPAERTMGNSILQSGAALGAVLTPLIVWAVFDENIPKTWRYPFWAVGGCGVLWVFLWWSMLRKQDLALPTASDPGPVAFQETAKPDLPTGLFIRRFFALIVLVVAVNVSWHFFRAWLPLFLREHHKYSANAVSIFIAVYYVATDLGSLSAGLLTLYLVHRSWSVHGSRLLVFLVFGLLAALSVAAAMLPKGLVLLGVLLVVGFGALGVFPMYYSFSQELTVKHQGKVTGTLGCCCWLSMAVLHAVVGGWVERTGSYTEGVALAGLAPLAGISVFVLLWGKTPQQPKAGEMPSETDRIVTRSDRVTTDVVPAPTGVTAG